MQSDPSSKPSGANPLIWVLVALGILVLILGAGIIAMLFLRPSSPPAPTQEATMTSLPSPTALPMTETPSTRHGDAHFHKPAPNAHTHHRRSGGGAGTPERAGNFRYSQ